MDRCGKCPRQHRLADAGDVLDEQMPLREQAHERGPHSIRLAVDDTADGGEDVVRRTRESARIERRSPRAVEASVVAVSVMRFPRVPLSRPGIVALRSILAAPRCSGLGRA